MPCGRLCMSLLQLSRSRITPHYASFLPHPQCRRAVCSFCLIVPEKYQETILEDGVDFCCLGCHELEDQTTRSSGTRVFCPYWVSLAYLKVASDWFSISLRVSLPENKMGNKSLSCWPTLTSRLIMECLLIVKSMMTPSPSFIYTLLAWILMGCPCFSSMNHSIAIFTLVTSSSLNSNLMLGPPPKRLTINWRWPVWSRGCSVLSLPMSSSSLPSTVRKLKVTCLWVTDHGGHDSLMAKKVTKVS